LIVAGAAWYLLSLHAGMAAAKPVVAGVTLPSTPPVLPAAVPPTALAVESAKPVAPVVVSRVVAETPKAKMPDPAPKLPIEEAARPPEAAPSPTVMQVEATKADGPASLQERLKLTNMWLNQQSPDRYSIQIHLISSGNQVQLERYLRKMETETGLDDIYVYSSQRSTGPRYGIVFGSFATRAEALAKLGQLSAQWGYHPQLRTIGGIRREVARNLG